MSWWGLAKDLLVRIGILGVGGGGEEDGAAAAAAAAVFRVGGYLPDYRFYIDVNNTSPFLTDLVLFSTSPSPHLSRGSPLSACCLDGDKFEAGRRARAYKKERSDSSSGSSSSSAELKLWLSVGGGGRSDHFLDDLDGLTSAIRELASKHQLDGVDLDCESFSSQQDYSKYMSWIDAAAPLFHQDGLLVSVALHAGQFLHPDVYERIDRVNLMAYDMQGPYHADLELAKSAVDKLVQSGCPTSKIMLGCPAYARHRQNPGDVKSYAELVDEREKAEPSATKLERTEVDDFHTFNGYVAESPKRIREKVAYARSRHLAGVFFWELGQDKQYPNLAPGGILLESAATAASSPVMARDHSSSTGEKPKRKRPDDEL